MIVDVGRCRGVVYSLYQVSMVRVFLNLFLADYTPVRSLTSTAMKELIRISVAISVDVAEYAYCSLFSDK